MSLTVIMNPNDANGDPAPSGDREYGCLTDFIPGDEGGVLGAVLRNSNHLGITDQQRSISNTDSTPKHP